MTVRDDVSRHVEPLEQQCESLAEQIKAYQRLRAALPHIFHDEAEEIIRSLDEDDLEAVRNGQSLADVAGDSDGE